MKKIKPEIVALRQLIALICKDKASIDKLIKAQKAVKKKGKFKGVG